MEFTFSVGWRAKHDVLATGYLCRRSQHEHRREEWGGATWNVESDFLDGHAFLPAAYTRCCLNLYAFKPLRLMELGNVAMSQNEGLFQFCTYQLLGFLHFFFADKKLVENHMVELLLIASDSIVTIAADIVQNGQNGFCELSRVNMWPLYQQRPLIGLGV